MKLTDRDTELFKALHESNLGTLLIDYAERLVAHVCDARNNDYADEVRKATADLLENYLIKKIQLTEQRSAQPETFE